MFEEGWSHGGLEIGLPGSQSHQEVRLPQFPLSPKVLMFSTSHAPNPMTSLLSTQVLEERIWEESERCGFSLCRRWRVPSQQTPSRLALCLAGHTATPGCKRCWEEEHPHLLSTRGRTTVSVLRKGQNIAVVYTKPCASHSFQRKVYTALIVTEALELTRQLKAWIFSVLLPEDNEIFLKKKFCASRLYWYIKT